MGLVCKEKKVRLLGKGNHDGEAGRQQGPDLSDPGVSLAGESLRRNLGRPEVDIGSHFFKASASR